MESGKLESGKEDLKRNRRKIHSLISEVAFCDQFALTNVEEMKQDNKIEFTKPFCKKVSNLRFSSFQGFWR